MQIIYVLKKTNINVKKNQRIYQDEQTKTIPRKIFNSSVYVSLIFFKICRIVRCTPKKTTQKNYGT